MRVRSDFIVSCEGRLWTLLTSFIHHANCVEVCYELLKILGTQVNNLWRWRVTSLREQSSG